MKSLYYPLLNKNVCFLISFFLLNLFFVPSQAQVNSQYQTAAITARCLSEFTACPERKVWMIKYAEWNECMVKTLITRSGVSPESCQRLAPLTNNAPNCPEDNNTSAEEVNRYLEGCRNGNPVSRQSSGYGTSGSTNSPSSSNLGNNNSNSSDQKDYNGGNTEVGRAIIDRYNLDSNTQNELNKLKENDQAIVGGAMLLGEGIGKLVERRQEKKKAKEAEKQAKESQSYSQSTDDSHNNRSSSTYSQSDSYNNSNASQQSLSTNREQKKINDISYFVSGGIGGPASPFIVSNKTNALNGNPMNFSFSVGVLKRRGLSWTFSMAGMNQKNDDFIINAESNGGDYYDYSGILDVKATDYQISLGKDIKSPSKQLHYYIGLGVGALSVKKHYWEHDNFQYEESTMKALHPHGSGNMQLTYFFGNVIGVTTGVGLNVLFKTLKDEDINVYKASSFLNWNLGLTLRFAHIKD